VSSVADAFGHVPRDLYFDDPLRGATEHWSDPEAIRRELTALHVRRVTRSTRSERAPTTRERRSPNSPALLGRS
jgi:hypothetical protein